MTKSLYKLCVTYPERDLQKAIQFQELSFCLTWVSQHATSTLGTQPSLEQREAEHLAALKFGKPPQQPQNEGKESGSWEILPASLLCGYLFPFVDG